MDNLFSTTVTNEQILRSFDQLYSVLKEGDVIENTSVSRVKLDNGNFKVTLEIGFSLPVDEDEMDEDFKLSSGDKIKINIEK